MSSPEVLSLFGFAVMGGLLFAHRNSLRNPDCMGIFLLTQTVFVVLGVLFLPWALPYLGRTYPIGQTSNLDLFAWLYIEALRSEDLIRAIVLTVGGTALVVASYKAAKLVRQPASPRLHPDPRSTATLDPGPSQFELGFSQYRLRLLSSLSMAGVVALLFAKRGTILAGLHHGLLQGQYEAVLEARYAVTEGGYILWQMCCNILPFFAAAEWLAYRSKKQRFAWYPYLIVGLACLCLILLFQKRPLIIFLATLSALEFFARNRRARVRMSIVAMLKNPRLWRLAAQMLVVLTVLMALYWATTRIGREGAGFFEATFVLLAVSVTRIFGRLSLPAVMYSHYFPSIAPHYGIHNIGLVTRLLGTETYPDTPLVFSYFSNSVQEGSVANCAIMDFYGGFGWPGWFVGCLLLGILIQQMDMVLKAHRDNGAQILGKLFCFVFVYYLSQSSLPRSLWGYGGLYYLACWYCLTGFSTRTLLAPSRPLRTNSPHSYRLARTLD